MSKNKSIKDSSNNESSSSLISKKLLGSLECEVMECMWGTGEATVQDIFIIINAKRSIAYTTIMTVMGHLVEKGLLSRIYEGKRYLYKVAQTKEEFLRSTSQTMVREILKDFGDLAISGFMGEITKVKPEKMEELKALIQEALNEDTASD